MLVLTRRLVKDDSAATALHTHETTFRLALNRGKYDKAEKVRGLTLELMKRVLRKEHPSMLTTVYCLANCYA